MTTWVVLNPWRLCRELEVDHPLRSWRLARFSVTWMLIAHMIAVGLLLSAAAVVHSAIQPPGMELIYDIQVHYLDWLPDQIHWSVPFVLMPLAWEFQPRFGTIFSPSIPLLPVVSLVLGPAVLMPLWTALLGPTFRLARVRRVHLLRGFALCLPGAVAWMVFFFLYFIQNAIVGASGRWDDPRAVSAALYLVYILYHVTWWYLFVSRYLRLRHAVAVVGVHFFMTSLLLVAAGAMFYATHVL